MNAETVWKWERVYEALDAIGDMDGGFDAATHESDLSSYAPGNTTPPSSAAVFRYMEDEGLVETEDDTTYALTDQGEALQELAQDYPSISIPDRSADELQEAVLDYMAEHGEPVTKNRVAIGLGYWRPDLGRHHQGLLQVRKALSRLCGHAKIATTRDWHYRLSTREKERRTGP